MRCYSKFLELSKETGEDSGCTEARLWCHTAIADCYTEARRAGASGKGVVAALGTVCHSSPLLFLIRIMGGILNTVELGEVILI
jgi:hypothetical protein